MNEWKPWGDSTIQSVSQLSGWIVVKVAGGGEHDLDCATPKEDWKQTKGYINKLVIRQQYQTNKQEKPAPSIVLPSQ